MEKKLISIHELLLRNAVTPPVLAQAVKKHGVSGWDIYGTFGSFKKDSDAVEELALLERYVLLIEEESIANKKIKDAQKALDLKVIAKYGDLSEDEIKTLVVHDKWLAVLAASVQSELSRVSQALTGRIKQLADRYAIPLPQLIQNVESLSSRVNEHLAKMGFKSCQK